MYDQMETPDIKKIDQLFKISDSIRIELIPGSALHLDMKSFNWTVEYFDENQMKLKFNFDHPMFISQGDLYDIIKVSFWNTNLFMFPKDTKKAPIPDGYSVTSTLTPQIVEGKVLATEVLPSEE